jgi:hypothetical protein
MGRDVSFIRYPSCKLHGIEGHMSHRFPDEQGLVILQTADMALKVI